APRRLHAARQRRDRTRHAAVGCRRTERAFRDPALRRHPASDAVRDRHAALMAAYAVEPRRAPGAPERTAILLCNLGTPEAPAPDAVRRYLAEFLSDPRVVE